MQDTKEEDGILINGQSFTNTLNNARVNPGLTNPLDESTGAPPANHHEKQKSLREIQNSCAEQERRRECVQMGRK